jgi:hypothetical protein
MINMMTKLNTKRALALVCLLLLLMSSSAVMGQRRTKRAAGQTSAAPQDFYPLRPGDSWSYRHSEGNPINMKVLREEKQADGTVQYVVELSSGTLIDYFYSKADGWVLLHRTTYPDQENGPKFDYSPPKQYLKNPLTVGAKWSWAGKDGAKESNEVIGQEWIEVPAGRFKAMKVLSKVSQPEGGSTDKTYWYVEGVGLVKSMTEARSSAGQFNYGYELVDYSFKKGSSAKPATVAAPKPPPTPSPTP